MTGPKASYLLATLLALLGACGLAPEALDPWHAWVTFKSFARQVHEVPDPGVSVQLHSLPDRPGPRLFFVRQVLVPARRDWLAPVGGIVCELGFAPRGHPPRRWAAWSFDAPTFEHFVDRVEQCPAVAELLNEAPVQTSVYWEDA